MKKGLFMIVAILVCSTVGFAQNESNATSSNTASVQTELMSSQPIYVNPMDPADEVFYFKYNAEYFSTKCQGNCENCPYNAQCPARCKTEQATTARPSVCQFKPMSEETANMDARLQRSIQLSQIK